MIILSLGGPDPRRAARILADPPRGAEAVELRLDLLRRPSLASIDPARWRRPSIPRIATCRSARHGGGFSGPELERARLLSAAAAAGFDYVDVESGTAAARTVLARAAGRVILSSHDGRRTPPLRDLLALHHRMAAAPGVAVVKIVTTARRSLDILVIKKLLARSRRAGRPLAAFAMGPLGVASRLLASAWGSWATYVALDRSSPTAPGQITLEEARHTYRIGGIRASTRLTGIVGDPVSHSLSPVIHNAAYAGLGMDWRYLPLPLDRAAGLPELLRGLALSGVSVTAPHKVALLRSIDKLDVRSRRTGALNTIVRERSSLRGFNTDIHGIATAVLRRLEPAGRVALILGAGGAARAAVVALGDLGARIIVASRRRREGLVVAELAGGRWIPFHDARRERWDILINATPIGSEGRRLPIPRTSLRGALIGDLVYRAGGRTPLVAAARELGLPAFGGEEVLLEQAIEQFRLFTGRRAPRRIMQSALARASRRAGAAIE